MNDALNRMDVESCHTNAVELYRGLNIWQLTSKPEHIRKHYHKQYVNQRLQNICQHAFLEIPRQLWDTELISMKFRQKKVFPTELAWISVNKDGIRRNNDNIECKKSEYISTGGPVKLMSWCPNVSDINQILAVLVSPNIENHKLEIEPKENNDFIQIWDFGNAFQQDIVPKLLYSFKHQWGSITSLQWISPDTPNLEAVKNSLNMPTETNQPQPLYGHILFCCTDGFMRICPIPHFSDEQLKSGKKKLLQFNPNNVLKLGLGHDYLNDARPFFGYPTCASWNSRHYKWFVAGYSTGHIGIFDLSCVNLFHYDCVHHYMISIHKRRLSYYPITNISISSNDWQLFNYTVDSGNAKQCNFLYKFTEPTFPVVVVESDKAVNLCVWPARSDLLVTTPVTCDRVDITSIVSRKMVSIPVNGLLNLVSLSSDNSILLSRDSGSVEIVSLNDPRIVRSLMTNDAKLDDIYTPKAIRYYRLLSTKNSKGHKVQTLVDCKLQEDIKLHESSATIQCPRINVIEINPNIGSVGWAAVGFDCGVVHLLRVEETDSDIVNVEEKFSTAMKLSTEPKLLKKNIETKSSKKVKDKVRVSSKTKHTPLMKEDSAQDNVRKSKPTVDSTKPEKRHPLDRILSPEKKKSVEELISDNGNDTKLVPYFSDEDIIMDNDNAKNDDLVPGNNNQIPDETYITLDYVDSSKGVKESSKILGKLDEISKGSKEDNYDTEKPLVDQNSGQEDVVGSKEEEMDFSDFDDKNNENFVQVQDNHSGLLKEDKEFNIVECGISEDVGKDIVHNEEVDAIEEDLVNSIWDDIAEINRTTLEENTDAAEEEFVNSIARDFVTVKVKNVLTKGREVVNDGGLNDSSDDTDISLNVIDCSVNAEDSVDLDITEEVKEMDNTVIAMKEQVSEKPVEEPPGEKENMYKKVDEQKEVNSDRITVEEKESKNSPTEKEVERISNSVEEKTSDNVKVVNEIDQASKSEKAHRGVVSVAGEILSEKIKEDRELTNCTTPNESNKDSRIQVIFDDSDLCVDYSDSELKDTSKPIETNNDASLEITEHDESFSSKENSKKINELENVSVISGNIFDIIHKSIIMPDNVKQHFDEGEARNENNVISIDLAEEENCDDDCQLIDVVTVCEDERGTVILKGDEEGLIEELRNAEIEDDNKRMYEVAETEVSELIPGVEHSMEKEEENEKSMEETRPFNIVKIVEETKSSEDTVVSGENIVGEDSITYSGDENSISLILSYNRKEEYQGQIKPSPRSKKRSLKEPSPENDQEIVEPVKKRGRKSHQTVNLEELSNRSEQSEENQLNFNCDGNMYLLRTPIISIERTVIEKENEETTGAVLTQNKREMSPENSVRNNSMELSFERDNTETTEDNITIQNEPRRSKKPKIQQQSSTTEKLNKEDNELMVTSNSGKKKNQRRSSTTGPKPWHTRKITVEWVEGKFKGVQQSISGRLLDDEPTIGEISQVRWSKPSSQNKYPARIIEIML